MAAVAPASKTLFFKNIAMILLFLIFALLFLYDGWKGYPERNDRHIAALQEKLRKDPTADYLYLEKLNEWPGWNKATPDQRTEMTTRLRTHNHADGWKTSLDILGQQILSVALVLGVLWAIWRAARYARRRAVADDAGLTLDRLPAVPWDAITQVDNRRWKKSGIVTITYRTPAGESGQVELDDYILDHDSLIPVLNELSTRAEKAEFLNPESPAPETPT